MNGVSGRWPDFQSTSKRGGPVRGPRLSFERKNMEENLQQTKKELANAKLRREVNGVILEAQVSPCVWMYNHYPFQITVTMIIEQEGAFTNAGNVFLQDKSLTFDTASVADLERLLNQVGVVPCTRCGKPAFDPTTASTNRDSLCEFCFIDDLNKEYQNHLAAEKAKLAKKDDAMRKKGYKFRVDAWIHPDDGEDRAVTLYMVEASTKSIEDVLRKAGSTVLDDYTIDQL